MREREMLRKTEAVKNVPTNRPDKEFELSFDATLLRYGLPSQLSR